MNNSMSTNLITLNEMEQFFERHNLQEFSQEEIDNLTRPIFIKETESITFQHRKYQAPYLKINLRH